MSDSRLTSLLLCPLNFCAFERVIERAGSLEGALLLSRLSFHQQYTKIVIDEKFWIVRTRDQISRWFGFSQQKVDRILNSLQQKGLLEKKAGLWCGKKSLYLHVVDGLETCPVNFERLRYLEKRAGSLKSALVLSRIAFALANTNIIKDNKRWCSLSRFSLASWSKLSRRTIDRLLDDLMSQGFLLKKTFHWNNKNQLHFHIPQFVIESLCQQRPSAEPHRHTPKVIHNQNGNSGVAKTVVSIIRDTKRKKTNNNTRGSAGIFDDAKHVSDSALQNIGGQLTTRQLRYLASAVSRTLERYHLPVSNLKALLNEVTFSVLSPHQHKHVQSFTHKVSRCMAIIKDRQWRTPIGYVKHCEQGMRQQQRLKQQDMMWQEKKAAECLRSFGHSSAVQRFERQQLTEKAVQTAERIKRLPHYRRKGESDNAFDYLQQQLVSYLQQGADKTAVKDYFQRTEFAA